MFNARLRIDENIYIILGPEVTGLSSPGTPLPETFTRVRHTDALLAIIFTDTLDETRSPARAIQALRTTLYRMVYSDAIRLSPNDSATTTTTTTWASAAANGYASVSDEVAVLAPAGRTGFYAVLANVMAYVAVSALVIVLFCRAALWSLLEQA